MKPPDFLSFAGYLCCCCAAIPLSFWFAERLGGVFIPLRAPMLREAYGEASGEGAGVAFLRLLLPFSVFVLLAGMSGAGAVGVAAQALRPADQNLPGSLAASALLLVTFVATAYAGLARLWALTRSDEMVRTVQTACACIAGLVLGYAGYLVLLDRRLLKHVSDNLLKQQLADTSETVPYTLGLAVCIVVLGLVAAELSAWGVMQRKRAKAAGLELVRQHLLSAPAGAYALGRRNVLNQYVEHLTRAPDLGEIRWVTRSCSREIVQILEARIGATGAGIRVIAHSDPASRKALTRLAHIGADVRFAEVAFERFLVINHDTLIVSTAAEGGNREGTPRFRSDLCWVSDDPGEVERYCVDFDGWHSSLPTTGAPSADPV